MACDLTSGRLRQCKELLGGSSSVFFINFIKDAFTVDPATNTCTAINPAVTQVFEYEITGDLNTVNENMIPDRNTGTRVNTQTATISLTGLDAATSAELNIMAAAQPICVVADRTGVYHALGLDDGMDVTVDGSTGGAKTDFNGHTLTGVATTGTLSPKLDEATIAALLALVA